MNKAAIPDRHIREHVAKHCVCCGSVNLIKTPAILMPFIAHRVFDWKPVEIDQSWGLQTIKEGMAYSLCNTLSCEECELVFLDIRFSDSELAALYRGYRDDEYTRVREVYEPGYKERNEVLKAGGDYVSHKEKFLANHLSLPARILDWGGDTGKNTPFKENNQFIHIYDIGERPVIEGAQRVEKGALFANDYDLIVCSHVLEHVPFPADLIEEIKNVMQKDTLLYLEVPYENLMQVNANDAKRYQKKRHWHEHINFYSRQSLMSLLQRCGLDVLEIKEMNVRAEGNFVWMFQLACKLKT